MHKRLEIELPDRFDWQNFLACLRKSFSVSARTHPECLVEFLDTFDWRFFKASICFTRIGTKYELSDIYTGKHIAEFLWRRKKPYRSAAEIIPENLKTKLSKIQGPRAVIRIAELKCKTSSANIINEDGKTIAHISKEQLFLPQDDDGNEKALKNILLLYPIKGYTDEFKIIKKTLDAYGLPAPISAEPLIITALGAIKVVPCKYSSRIRTPLKAELSIQEAAVMLCRDMVKVMTSNEKGIIEDIDIEFLHDYRVTIRRTRALLTQLKGVFSPDKGDAFKQRFGALGKMTNHMRDYDVLLSYREKYQKMLPPVISQGLKPFFQSIVKQRRKEYLKISKYLQSNEYHELISDWSKFLKNVHETEPTQHSEDNVVEFTSKRILKRYHRIVKIAEVIDENTPYDEVHALRIECKKLRYMLEFFAPLYDKNLSDPIARLKKLQTLLGDFNDLCVQSDALSDKIKCLAPKGTKSLHTAAALGGLIALLSIDREEIRYKFKTAISDFICEDNLLYFQNMFAGKMESDP
ncbi:MAG: CHAD domain-containing protein [Lentisphaerae bacterium]|nr:CHAD domain-containing protein [Lentisphaerota bacterium]MCP4103417.1 CHAD domain-containing protein [Lentisphaerota bacterium]